MTVATPELPKVEVAAPRADEARVMRWTRGCPLCGRLLGKDQPLDRIWCACGWEWA